ncbi:MAG: type II toxin-antitoxin system PemK/MazF family toxin [Mariprofundaceae bacterium]
MVKKASQWSPNRQDIIWMNCNPQQGQEMKGIQPFLVLSPQIFNDKTSLVIGLPMTTADYHVDNPFAVSVGKASGKKESKVSYVLCHQPKSFDWRARRAKSHPLRVMNDALFAEVCDRLNQVIQLP